MLRIAQLTDAEKADEIMHHPDVWSGVKDDVTPESVSLKEVIGDKKNVCLGVYSGTKLGGHILFTKNPDGSYEMHTSLTKAIRGRSALDAGWACVAWVFRNLPTNTIATYVFSTAKPALVMMRIAGWDLLGTEPYPNLVNGQKVDKVWFSITRDKWENLKN